MKDYISKKERLGLKKTDRDILIGQILIDVCIVISALILAYVIWSIQ